MNRKIIMSVMALVVLSLTTLSFAETYQKSLWATSIIITGTVVSVDTAKNNFVVEDRETGKQKVVYADANTVASLHAGDPVRVILPQVGNLAIRVNK